MPDNFQKTVNLKAQEEKKRRALRERLTESSGPAKKKTAIVKKAASRAKDIDRVYDEKAQTDDIKDDLRKINRPKIRPEGETLYKSISIILAAVILILGVYFLFLRGGEANITVTSKDNTGSQWYSVELVNGDTYYGKIKDKTTDPIMISSVYYNYDQLNAETGGESEAGGNLRLVKRGKETHGPSGTMYIYQAQIKIIDELSEESKVLKAILDYEK